MKRGRSTSLWSEEGEGGKVRGSLSDVAATIINELKKGKPMTAKDLYFCDALAKYRSTPSYSGQPSEPALSLSSSSSSGKPVGKPAKRNVPNDNLSKRLSMVLQILDGLTLIMKRGPGYKKEYIWTGKVLIPNPQELKEVQQRLMLYQIASSKNEEQSKEQAKLENEKKRSKDGTGALPSPSPAAEAAAAAAADPEPPKKRSGTGTKVCFSKTDLYRMCQDIQRQSQPPIKFPFWLVTTDGEVTKTSTGLQFSDDFEVIRDIDAIRKVYGTPKP